MRKLLVLGLLLLFSGSLTAETGVNAKAIPIQGEPALIQSGQRAPCTMAKHNGNGASYWSRYEAGTGTYTYYNPEVECGTPTYPFEITAFSFTLFDPGTYVWPADIDIVVYYPKTPGDSCSGPGLEVCRYTTSADQLTYEYPTLGTYTLPGGCCVYAPFFMGIEYNSGDTATNPSVVYDNNVPPDTCDNWMLNAEGLYYEWFNFWNQPGPGYPIFEVDGETVSTNCYPDTCLWSPGDPHKMHYPQTPNPSGWDVNATWPMVLADDWMCWETGWVKDIHWWGSWRIDLEVPILYFILRIYSDIPADPPQIPYSRPGDMLWEYVAGPDRFTITDPPYPPEPEGFYDPSTGYLNPDDHLYYWQYNVCLDSADWFWQDESMIYWLSISAVLEHTFTYWGWKSTNDHWNDDAVWGFWDQFDWIDIWEPYVKQSSLDLAFVITGGIGEPTGACCYGGGIGCVVTTEDSCENVIFGAYQGDGTSCGDFGACCFQGGGCIDIYSICCENWLGGDAYPDFSCSYDIQACCLSDGSCVDMDAGCCLAQYGTPGGPGSSCSGVPWACCLSDGTCLVILDSTCCALFYYGTPSPYSQYCLGDQNGDDIDDACQALEGACCLENGLCVLVTEDSCTNMGADYQGDGTVCLGDSDGDGKDDLCVAPWPSHKMHFPQLPDSAGWDVSVMDGITLADDWECSESGWVKDIHFWGSWLDDIPATIFGFVLVIWPDIPANPPQIPYSRPGYPSLWSKSITTFDETAYEPQTLEGWYDPQQGFYGPDNHQSFIRYDIELDSAQWFWQEEGTIYWLSVLPMVIDPGGEAKWGWKSSINHFNDDAVWAPSGPPFDWIDMFEPPNFIQSLDLAFVITGGVPCSGMCGDANNDGSVNVADAVWIINYVFAGGLPPQPILACGDANSTDGTVNVADAVWIINYVFAGGAPPGDCSPGSPNWTEGDCCPFVPPRK